MTKSRYPGRELELFARAHNWKQHIHSFLAPYLQGDVLEVGAGAGGTTRFLCTGTQRRWYCLEPDPALLSAVSELISASRLPPCCTPICGIITDIPDGQSFDAIVYIDVLEHIQDDAGELAEAAARLAPGGHLVVLVPAHQWLYSPFDNAVGHYRRYSRASLVAAAPKHLALVNLRHLDTFGLLASAANKVWLRRGRPTERHIRFWDSVLVKASRIVDPLLRYKLGKSLLGVWRRPTCSASPSTRRSPRRAS